MAPAFDAPPEPVEFCSGATAGDDDAVPAACSDAPTGDVSGDVVDVIVEDELDASVAAASESVLVVTATSLTKILNIAVTVEITVALEAGGTSVVV